MENQKPLENSSESTFEKTSSYVDGEKVEIYTNSSGDPMVLKDENYISLFKLSDDGNLHYYINSELKDFLIFTSKDKVRGIIDNADVYSKIVGKIKNQDPSMIKTASTKGASANAGSPSITIATSHSFGGYTFTKSSASLYYGNPHLRCNQFETDCIDFNDQISSIKITQGVYAEFYSGSFSNTGSLLYMDGRNGPIEVAFLPSSWNDRITSFWASSFTTSVSLNLFPGLYGCTHNYDDPLCP